MNQMTPSLPPRELLRFTCDNLQFQGDPHLTCVSPGRRTEANYLAVGLDKIRQSREIAEENNSLMIFLGDMLDNADHKKNQTEKIVENTNMILSGFARAMMYRECITIPGNHEKKEVSLTTGTTLATMRDLGLVNVIEPSGPYAIIECRGQKVGLGGTPFGEEIPRDVRGIFGEEVDRVVWITHDQFEFDIKNPFLSKTFEIKGCDMVINGHDHTTWTPQQQGQTWWHNPGNLLRMSVDAKDHKPAAWLWNPEMSPSEMKPHYLKVNDLAFDLTGLQIQADHNEVRKIQAEKAKSLFSELLINDKSKLDMERSQNGDMLLEDIHHQLNNDAKMSDAAKKMLLNLHMRVAKAKI